MSTEALAPQAVANITDTEDDHNHTWCCDDENTALCGVDLTDAHIIGPGEEIDCADCVRLEAADSDWIGSALDDGQTRCPHCPLNVLCWAEGDGS